MTFTSLFSEFIVAIRNFYFATKFLICHLKTQNLKMKKTVRHFISKSISYEKIMTLQANMENGFLNKLTS